MAVLYTKVGGWGEDGSAQVTISGLLSTTRVQRSFPNCTVSVFNAGTQTLATIFSDNAGTPLANPFTAAASGQWSFYAAPLSHLDITFSGGGIVSPFTLSDFVAPILTSSNVWTRTAGVLSPTTVTDIVLVGSATTDASPSYLFSVAGGAGMTLTALSTASSSLSFGLTGSGGGVNTAYIKSDKTASAGNVYLPLTFWTQNTEVARFNLVGSMLLGSSSSDTNVSKNVITVGNKSGLTVAGAAANASVFKFQITNFTSATISSENTGSGTVLPISFEMPSGQIATFTTSPFFQLTGSYSGGTLSAAGTVAMRNNAGVLEKSENGGAWTAIAGTGITGSGTTGFVSKFTSASAIASGSLFEPGSSQAGSVFLGASSSDIVVGAPTIVTFGVNSALVAANGTVNGGTVGISVNNSTASLTADRTSSGGTRLPLAFNVGGQEMARFTIQTFPNFLVGGISNDYNNPGPYIAAIGNNCTILAVGSGLNASYIGMSVVNGTSTYLASQKTSGSGVTLPMTLLIGLTTVATFGISGGGGGVAIGAPTGGVLGTGTINVATNLFLNNAAYTNPDFALEHWARGTIKKYKANPGADRYGGLLPLADVELFVTEHLYLPQLNYFQAHDQPAGMKERGDVSLLLHEETFIHLFDHEHRLLALESRLRALEGE